MGIKLCIKVDAKLAPVLSLRISKYEFISLTPSYINFLLLFKTDTQFQLRKAFTYIWSIQLTLQTSWSTPPFQSQIFEWSWSSHSHFNSSGAHIRPIILVMPLLVFFQSNCHHLLFLILSPKIAYWRQW